MRNENLNVADAFGKTTLRMHATIIVHACARYGSEHLLKNGHADDGAQWTKCLGCVHDSFEAEGEESGEDAAQEYGR